MVRLLAYQYRDLFDPECNPDERRKFKKFLKNRLGLDLDRELSEGSKKVIRFSYPDLEYYPVPELLIGSLKQDFSGNFSGATLKNVYVVYVRQQAPQIGFTASVVFDIELDAANPDELKDRFERQLPRPSQFHEEFKRAWESQADKRQTLPVVIFADEPRKGWLFPRDRSFQGRVFGSAVKVILPSGRSVDLERGFPYVSYVLHSDVSAAAPEKMHKCDFAILMALPGFVETKLEAIRSYRDKLREVQRKLEGNDFRDAERRYSEAWQGFEVIQGLMPTTSAAVQRIKQKYPGNSLFATIADDNTQLIQSTVTAAIEATDQVRANIQSFAERRLQRSVNRLQGLTALLTGILVVAAAITAYVAFWGTTKTNITNALQIRQPIRVNSEPIPDDSAAAKASLKVTPLFGAGTYPLKTVVPLEFREKLTEIPVVLATPMAAPGGSRIELMVFGEDGAVLAENSLATTPPPVAVRLILDSKLFNAGREYYLEVKQDPTWSMKLPIKVTFAK